jgi:hypothetical protein
MDFFDPQTVWLNVTNLALGVVTLLCILAVGWGVVSELLARSRKSAPIADDHAFAIPGLGWTMADGGKRLDETDDEKS